MAMGWDDLLLALGGDFLKGLGSGMTMQERQSYGGLAPTTLNDAISNIKKMGNVIAEQAARPVTLGSSYVQPLPTFTGGGLPMPIGLLARDPALSNPSLLNNKSMTLNFGAGGPFAITPSGTPPGDPYNPNNPDQPNVPRAGDGSNGGYDNRPNPRPDPIARRGLSASTQSAGTEDPESVKQALRMLGVKV